MLNFRFYFVHTTTKGTRRFIHFELELTKINWINWTHQQSHLPERIWLNVYSLFATWLIQPFAIQAIKVSYCFNVSSIKIANDKHSPWWLRLSWMRSTMWISQLSTPFELRTNNEHLSILKPYTTHAKLCY